MEANARLMDRIRHYCTYFDSRYLYKGLLTYESLRRHSSREIILWILCLDEQAYFVLEKANLSGVKLIRLSELESEDKELVAVKNNRSLIEYFFTCTPCLPKFILSKNLEINDITYIDGDLYFFADPELIFSEIGNNSIAITPHRFSEKNKFREQWGLYNVAFNFFRRDEDGMDCLDWWRNSCIEWCYDRLEDGKFADQKYLDDWPMRFNKVKVLDHPGVNLAPWNVDDAKLQLVKKSVYVNGKPLIFFHFHALKQITQRLFNPCWENYNLIPSHVLRFFVYQPYICDYYNHMLAFDSSLQLDLGLRDHLPHWIKTRTFYSTVCEVIKGRLLFGF